MTQCFYLGKKQLFGPVFQWALNLMVQASWIHLPNVLDNSSGNKQSIPFMVKNAPLKLFRFSLTMQNVLDLKILQGEKLRFGN